MLNLSGEIKHTSITRICLYMSVVMRGRAGRKAKKENVGTEQLGKGPTGKLARIKS